MNETITVAIDRKLHTELRQNEERTGVQLRWFLETAAREKLAQQKAAKLNPKPTCPERK